jgi:DNA repair protein RadC
VIIATASDAAALLVPLFSEAGAEKVVTAHLDSERRLIRTSEGKQGARDEVELPIRSIIEEALRLKSAGLIVAHNHPSGDPQPSEQDLRATRELARTAASLGIQLHDHLIFGADGDCRSLRALGLL